MKEYERIEIPNTGNYYGSLNIREVEDGWEMCTESYSGFHWNPIPEYLYEALLKYYNETNGG